MTKNIYIVYVWALDVRKDQKLFSKTPKIPMEQEDYNIKQWHLRLRIEANPC